MGLLSKTELLKKQELKKEKVIVDRSEKGEEEFVYVREMTGREKDDFEQSLIKYDEKDPSSYERSLKDFRAKIAVFTMCDENGNLLLEYRDYEVLSQHMSAKRLGLIVDAAQALNKISEEEKKRLLKNFVAGKTGNSTSASAKS